MSDPKSVRVPSAVPDQVDEALRLLAVHGMSALTPKLQGVVAEYLKSHRNYGSGLVYTLAMTLLLDSMKQHTQPSDATS